MGIERLENSKPLCYFSQVTLSFGFSLLCLPPLALEMIHGFLLHFHGPSQLLSTTSLLSPLVGNTCSGAGVVDDASLPCQLLPFGPGSCTFSYLLVTCEGTQIVISVHSWCCQCLHLLLDCVITKIIKNEQIFSNSWQYGR